MQPEHICSLSRFRKGGIISDRQIIFAYPLASVKTCSETHTWATRTGRELASRPDFYNIWNPVEVKIIALVQNSGFEFFLGSKRPWN